MGFPCLLFAWNLTCKSWVNCSCVRFARGCFSALMKSTGGSARFSGVTCKLSLPNTALHRRQKNVQHNVKYLFLKCQKNIYSSPWMLSDKMLVFRRDSFMHAFVGLRCKTTVAWPSQAELLGSTARSFLRSWRHRYRIQLQLEKNWLLLKALHDRLSKLGSKYCFKHTGKQCRNMSCTETM